MQRAASETSSYRRLTIQTHADISQDRIILVDYDDRTGALMIVNNHDAPAPAS